MKYIPGSPFELTYVDGGSQGRPRRPVLELTRRNLQALLDKLDDPHSQRTLIDPDGFIAVRAVEDIEHYRDRAPGTVYTNGVES